MDADFVVVGGGPAGLAATLRLLRAGRTVVLLDPGPYPRHRVCGEFFSPECRPLLEELGLPVSEVISHLLFTAGPRHFEMYLDEPAIGLSRYRFDASMLELCRKAGGERFTWLADKLTHIEPARGDAPCVLSTEKGPTLRAPGVLLACGRHSRIAQELWEFPSAKPTLPWVGFKFHVKPQADLRGLELHFFDGGYVGLSRVEDNIVNVCGLASSERLKSDGGVHELLQKAALENPLLRKRVDSFESLFEQPLTVGIPVFGARPVTPLEGVRVAGDMAGAIAPLAGEGLSMALRAGILAADSLLKGDAEGYARIWESHFGAPLRWGDRLQGWLTGAGGQKFMLRALRTVPRLGPFFFGRTRRRDWATI